jgi:hypothetical protein
MSNFNQGVCNSGLLFEVFYLQIAKTNMTNKSSELQTELKFFENKITNKL